MGLTATLCERIAAVRYEDLPHIGNHQRPHGARRLRWEETIP